MNEKNTQTFTGGGNSAAAGIHHCWGDGCGPFLNLCRAEVMNRKEQRYLEAVEKAMYDKKFFRYCIEGRRTNKILPPEKLVEIAFFTGKYARNIEGRRVKVYSLGINIFTGEYPYLPPEKLKDQRNKKAERLRRERRFKALKTNECIGIIVTTFKKKEK